MTMRAAGIATFFVFASFPLVAAGQVYLPGTGADLTISANPASPGPNELVTLTAQSALLDLSQATITWIVGGNKLAEGVGTTQVQLTTGETGSKTVVEADASAGNQSATATLTLDPQTVDLLFDAASYVPPFYKGRSLPSPASPLRVEAVPHIMGPNGEIAANQLVYTWKQDGEVLGSLSGLGRSTAVLDPPPLFGATVVTVDVRTADDTSAASASVRIPSVDPGITLYLDHPLFGIEYYNALPSRGSVADVESTFVAVPYFVAASGPADPGLSYHWQVNGSPLTSASSSSNGITLNATGVTGPATISLQLISPFDPYLDASGDWIMSFGQAGGNYIPNTVQGAPANAFGAQ